VLSCASITLPDGTKIESKGKAEAVILTPRDTWSAVIIPFSGSVVSEIMPSDIPGCPFLRRRYLDENYKVINEEYLHTCETASYVKSDITVWNFLEFLVSAWAMAGFP
jgi:hypothetical protein